MYQWLQTSDWEESSLDSCWLSISTAKRSAKISSLDSVDTRISSKDATFLAVISSKVLSKILNWVIESFSAANGSSDTVSSSSISENSASLKQFCTVYSVTLSHARASIFMASNQEISESDFLLSIASIIFVLIYFCTLLLKKAWPLVPLTIRWKLCLEEEKKYQLLLIFQYLDGLYSCQWWVQLSGFIFPTDCQALWSSFRKALNSSSFCSGVGNNKVIFWLFWNI